MLDVTYEGQGSGREDGMAGRRNSMCKGRREKTAYGVEDAQRWTGLRCLATEAGWALLAGNLCLKQGV